MAECTSCGKPYTPNRRSPGFAGQCPDCGRATESRRGVNRTLGLVGGAGVNKSGAISIWRDPSPSQRSLIRQINGGRYSANLGLGLSSTTPVEREED